MRFIRKLLLVLLCLIILALVAVYFVGQTAYAAKWVSQWVNDNTPYQLSLDNIDYDITEPSQLVLNGVELKQQRRPALLKAKKVTLGLTASLWESPLHFSSLLLEEGALELSSKTSTTLALSSDRLQLKNMALNIDNPNFSMQGERVNAGVIPWTLSGENLPDTDSHFELSADRLVINGIETERALVQGDIKNHSILFNNVGADLGNGLLTANGQRTAEGKWLIDSLRLSDVKYQSTLSLSAMLDRFSQLSGHTDMNIKRLDVLNSNIQGPSWSLSDFSLSLKEVNLIKGDWQLQSGTAAISALDIVYNDQHLISPVLEIELEQNKVKIKQFSSRWQDGLIRASGEWQRDTQTLTLDDVALTSLLYTLPKEWLSYLQQPQPEWLRELHITKLSTNRNIIIDINPEFPFQFTSVDLSGNNLQLIKDHQFGLWQGSLTVNASEATLNKIDLRHPSVVLTATPENVRFTEGSAFTKDGLIEATAVVGQQAERPLQLTLSGRSVPVNMLQSWGWQSIPLTGNGNVNLQLTGNLKDKASGKPELKGNLKMVNAEGQQLTQYLTRPDSGQADNSEIQQDVMPIAAPPTMPTEASEAPTSQP
ncbi:AsmA family protein [Budvicia diplopodorum]|uniref:AsmA family protein n=1 Tax=Budvicia diplopodorum TaxID=1119056 RepID=UPI001358394A|nr:AsmA family protein [Budvicia diplopodorum]